MPFKQQNNLSLICSYDPGFGNEEMDCKTIKILKQRVFSYVFAYMKHMHILPLTNGKVLSAVYPSGLPFIILSKATKWTPYCTLSIPNCNFPCLAHTGSLFLGTEYPAHQNGANYQFWHSLSSSLFLI